MNDLQYGEFINSIIRIADRRLSDSGGLARKYAIRPAGVDMVISNLSEGWDVFEQMASEMKKGYLSWTTTVSSALGTVISPLIETSLLGMRRSNALNYWGGDKKAINTMYENKKLIMDIYRIGRKMYSTFLRVKDDEQSLQELKIKAVNYLTDKE